MATEPAVTSGMPTHEALAMLPLPARLSNAQREGHVCVYDGDALTKDTAVDLGSRVVDGVRVFPRACRSAVGRAAMSVLFDHASGPDACPECKSTPDCETGRTLNRIIKGYLR